MGGVNEMKKWLAFVCEICWICEICCVIDNFSKLPSMKYYSNYVKFT